MDLWPACTYCLYDLSAIQASWTDSCPLHPTCPECGKTLDCAELRRIVTRGPDWSFETRRRLTFARFVKTTARLISLHPSLNSIQSRHPFRPHRLLLILTLLWIVLVGPLHALAVLQHLSLGGRERLSIEPASLLSWRARTPMYFRDQLPRDEAALPWWPIPSIINHEIMPASTPRTAPTFGSWTTLAAGPFTVESLMVKHSFVALYVLPGSLAVAIILLPVIQRGKGWAVPLIRMAAYSAGFAIALSGAAFWISVVGILFRFRVGDLLPVICGILALAGLGIAWWRYFFTHTRTGRLGASMIAAAIIVGGISSLVVLA
jgi:hypothetical protein